jgi:hypothetical protein
VAFICGLLNAHHTHLLSLLRMKDRHRFKVGVTLRLIYLQEDGLCEEVCKPPYGELGNGCEEPWDELYQVPNLSRL